MNKKTKDVLKNIVKVVCSIVSLVSILVCFSIKWMLETWENLTMDELVYHLNAPLDGTNSDMIWQYVFKCIVPTIIILIVIGTIMVILKKKEKNRIHIYYCIDSFSGNSAYIWIYSMEEVRHCRLYVRTGQNVYLY